MNVEEEQGWFDPREVCMMYGTAGVGYLFVDRSCCLYQWMVDGR